MSEVKTERCSIKDEKAHVKKDGESATETEFCTFESGTVPAVRQDSSDDTDPILIPILSPGRGQMVHRQGRKEGRKDFLAKTPVQNVGPC